MAAASALISSSIYSKTHPHHFFSFQFLYNSYTSPKLKSLRRIFPHLSLSCASNSDSSPFTEFDSVERHQRDSWLYNNDRDNHGSDIALQLPELKKLLQALKSCRRRTSGGNVWLVGTGPGDPDLLTLKAVRAIERADLVLYDRLVSNHVLEFVRDDARLIYVGKTVGYQSRTQEEIHELLLSFVEAGANVVRLKGGDPLARYHCCGYEGMQGCDLFQFHPYFSNRLMMR